MAVNPLRPVDVAKTFDEIQFLKMTAPFTVRIEKLKNNSRTPITVENREDGTSGLMNWSADDVRNIEAWLLNYAGEGLYEISLVDSSENPQKLQWKPFLQTLKVAPEPAPTAPVQSLQPQVPRMSTSFPNGLPQNPLFGLGSQTQQPQYYMSPGYPPMPPAPPVGTPQYQAWNGEAERRKQETEIERLRNEAHAREREALEFKHKIEMERMRAEQQAAAANNTRAADSKLDEVTKAIASLAATVTNLVQGNQNRGPDPAVEALKEQTRQLQAKLDMDAARAENDRREREMRDMIQRQADEAKRATEAQERRFELLLAKLTDEGRNRPDPYIELMKERDRNSAELIKEISRNNATALERVQGNIMSPLQTFQMLKDISSSTAQESDRVARTYDSVLNLQTKVMENALNMQPQGSPIIDAVRDGLGGVKDFADKFLGAKERTERLAMTAQVQAMQAQATVAQAQAAQQAMAQGIPVAVPPIVTPPPAVDPQLAGPAEQGPRVERLWGRTDEEWFGAILPDVMEMRAAVTDHVKASRLAIDNPRLKVEGPAPERAAEFIVMAINQVERLGVRIPALIDLVQKGQFSEFSAVLLPDAPEEYRQRLAKRLETVLVKLSKGEDPGIAPLGANPGEVDDGDDDEDEDDDEDGDTKPEVVEAKTNGVKTGKAKPAITVAQPSGKA